MRFSYLLVLALGTFSLSAKQIAITFDDAPLAGSAFMSGSSKTQKIIGHLTEAKVPDALFFVTTGNIKNDQDKLGLL